MKINQIAKNLLEGKTCQNCKYRCCEQGDVFFCDVNAYQDSNPYAGTQSLPKDETCHQWEEIPKAIEMNITSVPFSAKPQKLKIKWSAASEVELQSLHNLNIEDEFVKIFKRELLAQGPICTQ